MSESPKSYELEKRLLNFSKSILSFSKTLNNDSIHKPLVSQLIRSATSIGANYCEANNACSRKDFANKIFICKKEAQETEYWLEILKSLNNGQLVVASLFKECHEFVLIFQKIINTMKTKRINEK